MMPSSTWGGRGTPTVAQFNAVNAANNELSTLANGRSSKGVSSRVAGQTNRAPSNTSNTSNTTRAAARSRLAPGNPPDLNILRSVFPSSEWRVQLSKFSMVSLKSAARRIQAQNPGTKPQSFSRKADLVDYLLAHS